MAEEEEQEFPVMREQLAHLIGCRLLDISENDEDEAPFIQLMFDSGDYLKIPISEAGFEATENDEGEDEEP